MNLLHIQLSFPGNDIFPPPPFTTSANNVQLPEIVYMKLQTRRLPFEHDNPHCQWVGNSCQERRRAQQHLELDGSIQRVFLPADEYSS